jgi:hypothetical protein
MISDLDAVKRDLELPGYPLLRYRLRSDQAVVKEIWFDNSWVELPIIGPTVRLSGRREPSTKWANISIQ